MRHEAGGWSPLLVSVQPEVGKRPAVPALLGVSTSQWGRQGGPRGACWMPEPWKELTPGLVGWQTLTHRAVKVLCFKKSVYWLNFIDFRSAT